MSNAHKYIDAQIKADWWKQQEEKMQSILETQQFCHVCGLPKPCICHFKNGERGTLKASNTQLLQALMLAKTGIEALADVAKRGEVPDDGVWFATAITLDKINYALTKSK